MRVLLHGLLAAQLALAEAAFAAAGGTPLGALVVPDTLGGLKLSSITEYEKDNPGFGWGAKYEEGDFYGDAFFYTKGRERIADGADSGEFGPELASALEEIEAARRRGRYQSVTAGRQFDVMADGHDCFVAQSVSLRVEDETRPSIVAVGGIRNHFVKLRLTWTRPPTDVERAGEQVLESFCRDLRRLNFRTPLPAAGAGFGDIEWGASPDRVRQAFPELEPSSDERETCRAGRGKYVSLPFRQSRCELAQEGALVYAGTRTQATFIFDEQGGLGAVQVYLPPIPAEDGDDAKAAFEKTGKSLSTLYGPPEQFAYEIDESARGRAFVWDQGDLYCRMTVLFARGHLMIGVLHVRRQWMDTRSQEQSK